MQEDLKGSVPVSILHASLPLSCLSICVQFGTAVQEGSLDGANTSGTSNLPMRQHAGMLCRHVQIETHNIHGIHVEHAWQHVLCAYILSSPAHRRRTQQCQHIPTHRCVRCTMHTHVLHPLQGLEVPENTGILTAAHKKATHRVHANARDGLAV